MSTNILFKRSMRLIVRRTTHAKQEDVVLDAIEGGGIRQAQPSRFKLPTARSLARWTIRCIAVLFFYFFVMPFIKKRVYIFSLAKEHIRVFLFEVNEFK